MGFFDITSRLILINAAMDKFGVANTFLATTLIDDMSRNNKLSNEVDDCTLHIKSLMFELSSSADCLKDALGGFEGN